MMEIDTLTHFLESILKNKQAAGVDICGEVRLTPALTLRPDYQTILHKNERANIKILQTCLHMSNTQYIGA